MKAIRPSKILETTTKRSIITFLTTRTNDYCCQPFKSLRLTIFKHNRTLCWQNFTTLLKTICVSLKVKPSRVVASFLKNWKKCRNVFSCYVLCWKTPNLDVDVDYSNIYPTRCNVTQFIISENCSNISGGIITHHQDRKQLYLQHLVCITPLLLSAAIVEELELVWVCCGWSSNSSTIAADNNNGATNTRCYRYSCLLSWWWVVVPPEKVEQFPDIINCVTLHLVGYILEYSYDARTHER